MRKRKRKPGKIIITYILAIVGAAIGLALNILLARIVTIEDLDKIKYLVALITLLSNILVIGMTSFITREAKNKEQGNMLMSKCFSLYFLFSLMAIPILHYVLFNYAEITRGSYWFTSVTIVVSFVMGLCTLIFSFILGLQKYNLYYLMQAVIPKAILVLACLVFLGLSATHLLADYYLLIYLLIYTTIGLIFFIKYFIKFSLNLKKSEYLSIAFFFGTDIAITLSSYLTTILQENIFPDVVGVTSIIATSSLLMAVVSVFTNVLISIIKPVFAIRHKAGDNKGVIEAYRLGTRANLYLAIPVYLFFIIFPSKFLSIFNEDLTVYPYVMSVVVFTHLFSAFGGAPGTLLAMAGQERKQLFNTIAQLVVFVCCVFIFKGNAIYGLVLSYMISEMFIMILKFVEVGFIYKTLPIDLKSALILAVITIVNFLAIFGFSYIKITNIYVWFAVAIPLGLVLLLLNVVANPLGIKDFKQLISINAEKTEKNIGSDESLK